MSKPGLTFKDALGEFLEDPTPGVHHLYVLHDGWCLIFKGEECNCSPTFSLDPEQEKGTPAK